MTRSGITAVVAVGIFGIVSLLAIWSIGFLDGRRDLVRYEVPEQMTLSQVIDTYDESIEPILRAKCGQCHSDTEHRPFLLYHLPVVSGLFGRDFVDDEIRQGRVRFDFTAGFPTSRIGASMEHIQGLREAVVNETMPPLSYAIVRPHTFLNEREERIMLDWADRASEAVRAELARGPQRRLGEGDFERLARAMIAACPVVVDDGPEAQLACSQNLGRVDLLREGLADPILWGQQREVGEHDLLRVRSTRFNPRVWRMLYASLFMYEPGFRVERDGERTVLHLPVVFRSELDAGDYPYPLWHRPSKWDGYVASTELLLVARQGRIVGAMRGAAERNGRSQAREWDQRWTWTGADGAPEPRPSVLYSRVFSSANPFVPDLDAAYRELAIGLRDADCMECHSPDNGSGMRMLELFNYPNQALAARNRLVLALDENAMPPLGGIRDPETRRELRALAARFQQVAERALGHEEGRVEDLLDRPFVPSSAIN